MIGKGYPIIKDRRFVKTDKSFNSITDSYKKINRLCVRKVRSDYKRYH